MKNLKINSILIVLLLLTCMSCRKNFLVKPSIIPTDFSTTIPFEMRDGIIVVQVEIRGQLYDFMVDSGGLNLVSKKVAQELGLKKEFSRTFDGSQNGKTTIDFTTLENIAIGGIDFQETNIGIMDFEPINTTGCYNFQGMIGPPLMQNAIWEIDYQQQEIKIASDEATFDTPSNAERITFWVNDLLQPKMNIEVGGKLETFKIDLGNSGGFKIKKDRIDNLAATYEINKEINGYGRHSRAINGYGDAITTNFAQVTQLKIGDINLTDEIVVFKTVGSPTIGNQFFENYRVRLNWQEEEMILMPNDYIEKTRLNNFGIQPIFKDGQPSIGFTYANSSAANLGLDIDDVIIAVNGNSIQNTSKENWCEVSNLINNTTASTLSITINRSGQQMDFTLQRMELL